MFDSCMILGQGWATRSEQKPGGIPSFGILIYKGIPLQTNDQALGVPLVL